MKKKQLAVTLLCAAVLLSACAKEPEVFPVATEVPKQALSAPATSVPTQSVSSGAINFDDGSYDPTSEEGGSSWDDVIELGADATNAPVAGTPVQVINSEYAGASPVPIDPIDKPTPTPLPPLSFSEYATYEASRLHLSFQAPAGWTETAESSSTYTITNPDASVDFQAYVTITTENVTTNYTNSQTKKHVSSAISALKSGIGFKSFSAMKMDSRTLMDKNGYYNDFYGVTKDGASVYGRVHVACIDKTVYTLTIVCPRGYWSKYKDEVYGKIRSTMIITH